MDVGYIKENKTVKLHLDYYYYYKKKREREREFRIWELLVEVNMGLSHHESTQSHNQK